MLKSALQAWEFRNLRAHMHHPSEAESLYALKLLVDLLGQCGLEDARGRLEQLLVEAQGLVAKARDASNGVGGSGGGVVAEESKPLEASEWEALLLYRALLDFERQLSEVS